MALIAIIDAGYKSYEYEKTLFARHGYGLDIYQGDPDNINAKIDFIRQAEGVMVRGTKVGESFFSRARELKALVRYGIGFDNIDVEAASAHGIKVANVQGYGTQCVSDHAMALIFACIRGLPEGQKSITTRFGKPPFPGIFELHSKTLGIIGLGRIGGCLSDKCRHLFRRVMAVDPYIEDEDFVLHGAEKTDMDTLLKESHIISLHCDLNDETRNLIDREAFQRMGQGPVLINTSRGAVLDEGALLDALDERRIHSAGIDVYQNEPAGRAQKKLISHPGIIATGHYAWYSETSMIELQKRAAENMIALLKGEMIEDCLNP